MINACEVGMKLYIKMIKPVLSVPTSSQDYTPKHIPVESEDTWYQEEERESLIKKYEHLETTFERLIFEEKYKEFEQEPVMWSYKYHCFICSNCGLGIEDEVYYLMNKPLNFCPTCGRKIKWDD